jgi:hypothetical protein
MAKAILNYTTKVDPMNTATECIKMLAAHGATDMGLTTDQGSPTGLVFVTATPWGKRQFTMPLNIAGVERELAKAYKAGRIQRAYTGRDHATRVAWRVLKDWLEVQLALIDAGVQELHQLMVGYMNAVPGRTVYEIVAEQQLAIEADAR